MENWMTNAIRELLLDGQDDWVMVDNLIACAWESSDNTTEDPKKIAVDLLSYLLSNNLMVIGDLGENGIEPWTCPINEALDKFVEGCEYYAWEPQGALWWLEITDAGRKWLASPQ